MVRAPIVRLKMGFAGRIQTSGRVGAVLRDEVVVHHLAQRQVSGDGVRRVQLGTGLIERVDRAALRQKRAQHIEPPAVHLGPRSRAAAVHCLEQHGRAFAKPGRDRLGHEAVLKEKLVRELVPQQLRIHAGFGRRQPLLSNVRLPLKPRRVGFALFQRALRNAMTEQAEPGYAPGFTGLFDFPAVALDGRQVGRGLAALQLDLPSAALIEPVQNPQFVVVEPAPEPHRRDRRVADGLLIRGVVEEQHHQVPRAAVHERRRDARRPPPKVVVHLLEYGRGERDELRAARVGHDHEVARLVAQRSVAQCLLDDQGAPNVADQPRVRGCWLRLGFRRGQQRHAGGDQRKQPDVHRQPPQTRRPK